MEFLAEIAQLIGAKIVEASTKALETPDAQKELKQRINSMAEFFVFLLLVTSVSLPAYFLYSSYTLGQLYIQYFYIGIGFLVVTFFSHLLTTAKVIHFFKYSMKQVGVIESITVEDEIRFETGISILLAIATIIPGINLISLPLAIDRVIHVYEITSSNVTRQKTRGLIENIAFGSLFIFLASTLFFVLILIIAGDTRSL